MTFRYEDKIKVSLSDEVVRFLAEQMTTYSFDAEAGGILVGELSKGHHFTITNITTPQKHDVQRKYSFHRAQNGHQEMMDGFWEDSGYKKIYLGEWHTHCESTPNPSAVDLSCWKRIAKQNRNTQWSLFLIIGQQRFRLWTIDNGTAKELLCYEP